MLVSDIQDEEDGRSRKRRIVLDHLDDLDPPVLLHKKVQRVENARGARGGGARGGGARGATEESADLPVFLAGDDLLRETRPERSDAVQEHCRRLLASYDALSLHLLFDSAEENCRFRLYLYALAHGLGKTWPRDEIHIRVLHQVLRSNKVKLEWEGERGSGAGDVGSAIGEGKGARERFVQRNGIIVVREAFEVPQRILRLLGNA